MPTTYSNVSSASALSADITAIDQASTGSRVNYVITLAPDVTLTETADIAAISLKGADTLTIDGQAAAGDSSDVLNGAGAYRGLFVYSGDVTIENLTIEKAVARGGAGAGGGGGGAGLGGGLYLADDSGDGAAPANVTLDDVVFSGNRAVGGAGSIGQSGGGGGGLGGAGGVGGVAVNSSDIPLGGGGGGGGGIDAAGGVGGHSGGVGGAVAGGVGGIGPIFSPHGGGAGGGSSGGGGGSDGGGGGGGSGDHGGAGGGGGIHAAAGGGDGVAFSPGAGGYGGGGGGGSVGLDGGAGGFGGGGGGGYIGSRGGFGGGGGGSWDGVGFAVGGFGAGNGQSSGGAGGGLGAGGDIFVQAGASLTIETSTTGAELSGGAVTAGDGGGGGGSGEAFGSGIFLQGDENITFAPASGTTQTIADGIADETGSGGTGGNGGAGGLTLEGPGTLALNALNTFTGGVAVEAGTLSLGNSAGAGSGAIVFAAGANATLVLANGADPTNVIRGFGSGDAVDFTTAGFKSSYEAVWRPATGVLKIIDTANANAVVATLNLAGSLSGELVALSGDGAAGTKIDVASYSFATVDPGDVVVSSVSGQAYSAYENVFSDGVFAGIDYFFTNVSGAPYSAYQYEYSSGNDFIGSKFLYADAAGMPYTGYEYDYDGAGRLARVDFTGVTGAAYSSYEYDYVGGVFAGSKFTFANVPEGATCSSYETDYDQASNFIGDKFFFTNVAGQSYTGEEEDFDAAGKLSRVLISGVAGQAYSSLEEDYNAGAYAGYKAHYTGISGQSYTNEEVDVSAADQLVKVVYSGLSSAPYSSVEQDFSGGAPTDVIYDFNKVSGASYYADEVEENAQGVLVQTTYDLNSGGHAIVGAESGLTIASLADDVMTGGGSGETFMFNPIFGSDKITDFAAHDSGAGHDMISLSTTDFANFQTLLGDAQASGAGGVNTTITSSGTHDALTLNGVTTGQLASLAGDFVFRS